MGRSSRTATRIAQPPRALLDRFSAIVSPSFRLIHSLHLQIQNLRSARDLLLPRLLSGAITIEALPLSTRVNAAPTFSVASLP